MSKPISERLTPDMTRALRLGWGERGATVQGLVRRSLACPGSDTNRLRLTPMGQQWARMLYVMARTYATLGVIEFQSSDAMSRSLARSAKADIRPLVWP